MLYPGPAKPYGSIGSTTHSKNFRVGNYPPGLGRRKVWVVLTTQKLCFRVITYTSLWVIIPPHDLRFFYIVISNVFTTRNDDVYYYFFFACGTNVNIN